MGTAAQYRCEDCEHQFSAVVGGIGFGVKTLLPSDDSASTSREGTICRRSFLRC